MRLLLAEYFRASVFRLKSVVGKLLVAALAGKFDCFIFDVSTRNVGFDLLKRVRDRGIKRQPVSNRPDALRQRPALKPAPMIISQSLQSS